MRRDQPFPFSRSGILPRPEKEMDVKHRRLRHVFGLSVIAAGAAIALTAGTLPAQAATLPLANEATQFTLSLNPLFFNASPAGANVSCKPSAAHPFPVVLVEGTFASQFNSFGALSPDLVNNGYCVYSFNFGQTLPGTGIFATGDIRASAQALSAEVNRVLTQTGAAKVDIVGWSQGGMMPRQFINFDGGASKVNMLVGLAPSNFGTDLNGVQELVTNLGAAGLVDAAMSVTCTACTQQLAGSSFLAALNQTPTVAGVRYVVIETSKDEVVTPFTNAFLPAAANVQNITLQNQCSQDASDHISIPYDSNALQDVVNALGPDNPSFQPTCAAVGPIDGNV
jgi:triacylglycerol esterase/lipase EstA (alpha/beta hydrolase family)